MFWMAVPAGAAIVVLGELMRRLIKFVFTGAVVLFVVGLIAGVLGVMSLINPGEEKVGKDSLLAIDLDGVIIDAKETLEILRKYRKQDRIKGILLKIASPGGVVGPSQELYAELKRTRDEFKKPVIAYCSSVAASGAYYAAVAADQIYTTPGCMIGSIGALIEFVNLEKLYDWAKVHRYAVTTGKFKDAGAEYKPLAPEARELFQDMLNDVLAQFKGAIVEGRKMDPKFLDQYADGRVFTGAQAVKLGFADKVGTWEDARRALGELTGMGKDPEIFKVKKPRGLMEYFNEASSESKLKQIADAVLQNRLNAQPLMILPGAARF